MEKQQLNGIFKANLKIYAVANTDCKRISGEKKFGILISCSFFLNLRIIKGYLPMLGERNEK